MSGRAEHRRAGASGHPLPPGVCVLGLGLIGGSLLRAAGRHVPVLGWSPSEETRAAAADAGFEVADSLEAALRRADDAGLLTVLAAPLPAFDTLLRPMARFAPELLLTDVGSVKAPVAAQVAAILPRARFVGGHPMAGRTASGFAAGDAELFEGAAWVTCLDQRTRLDDWSMVAGLALQAGSRVVPCTAADHDAAVARVSHLPHLLALTLAQVGANGGPLALSLAAGSFRDGVRVAGTRAQLIRDMLEPNRESLVAACDDALGFLGVTRGSLASTGALAAATEAGHTAWQAYQRRGTDMTRTVLTDPTVDELLAIGTAGGFVRDIRTDSDDVTPAGDPVADRATGRTVTAEVPSDTERSNT